MSPHPNYVARPGFPPVILNLLIANVMVYILQMMFPGSHRQMGILEAYGALHHPGTGYFRPWQLLTYGFLHSPATFFHIFVNMFVLYMFGRDLEFEWGGRRFLVYYLLCILGAGATHLAFMIISGTAYPVLGASGATFGVLLAYGMRFPHREVMLLIPPIPMKARTLVILYGAVELLLGISGLHTGVAHFAHLGGLLTGLVILLYWRGKLPLKPRRPLP